MPLFNHPTLGDIQGYAYLEGKILKVYLEDASLDAAKWDTADVEYENHKVFLNAPVRYHCQALAVERANGAVADGGRGFDVGDKVILMAKIGSSPGLGEEYEKVYVVAHRDGVVPCTYNYLLIRIGAAALIPHNPPYGKWIAGEYVPTTKDSHLHEYCTVWDAAKGIVATIYNPATNLPYAFPVTVEEFKPALDYYKFVDEELFTLASQGDAQIQEAGFTPDLLSDFQGNKIRCGASPDSWWTSYDIFANPIFNLLFRTQMALATDSEGAGNGAFTKAMEMFALGKEDILKWKTASPLALNDDTRLFDVNGSDSTKEIPPETQARLLELQKTIAQMNDAIGCLDSAKYFRWEEITAIVAGDPNVSAAMRAELVALSTDRSVILYLRYKGMRETAQAEIDNILGKSSFTPWEIAHDKDMKPLKGSSYHMQTAYGEDEIWVCGKNVYQGLVVSACDAAWKFVRLSFIPPAVAIGNPHLDKLAGGGIYFLGGAGASLGSGQLISDVSFALAASTMTANDNNIFSYGTLKRINDGGFHRTTHPALKTGGVGSWRMTQNKIPLSPLEATFITALNTRVEHIDVWNRYDNWMNSIQYSAASWGVDRTWWFKSNAQQWRIKANFIDTPIGSMWHSSPVWEVALWYMTGFRILDGGPTCRRDAPLKTQFIRQTKHSKRVVAQIYIVQRQAVTMWDDPARTFVIQQLNKGIYDHFVPADIKYVAKDLDGLKNDDYTTLTDEEKQAQISDRVYLRSQYPGEVGYGASRKDEVDAIKEQADKAAKLARELIGDYGNISHAGQYIRERMIPFYSWLEINAPRYVRLFRNLKDEGGGGIGALGGVLAWKTAKLAVKASALMGLVMLWNAAFFPDEEDDLQETGRESLHMILGRRANGSIITIRFQGALADALSWFGMGNPVEQVKKFVSGTKGVGDLAKDVVRGAPLKLFQGFRPEPKLLYETLSGQSFFPDPMHPRPIRDTTEHILRTFSLDKIYNQVSGKPKQGGTWSAQMYRDIQSLALTEADPGEQAYYTSRKYIFDWLDKQGKEKPVAMPTNRSNSLYYYKQALKFGDFDAAEKYLKKYQDMGGKLHDVQGSIRRVHPLASLRLADRYKFKASLSPEQQETLSVATSWYKKHYVETYQEQRKRGL